MKVVQAVKSDLIPFFNYLENHLSENGQDGTPLFQPLSREITGIPESTKDKFAQGFSSEFSELSWRQLWLVKDSSEHIRGHIDLRHHNDSNCSHRVLLGMGVDSSCRKQGVGTKLVDSVITYCQEHEEIEWLDLCVLSENTPAKNLYLKAGFYITGEFEDQYRIDGRSIAETAMTLRVKMPRKTGIKATTLPSEL